MFYKTSVPVPPDTPESAPVEKILTLAPGRVRWWFVGFPPGCADLVHVTIHRFEHQIVPEGEGESLQWGGYMFPIEDSYDITDEPHQVLIRAWNLDDSYEHTVFVGAVVLPEPEVTAESLLQRLLHALVGT